MLTFENMQMGNLFFFFAILLSQIKSKYKFTSKISFSLQTFQKQQWVTYTKWCVIVVVKMLEKTKILRVFVLWLMHFMIDSFLTDLHTFRVNATERASLWLNYILQSTTEIRTPRTVAVCASVRKEREVC